MITDEMLQKAAQDAALKLNNYLPQPSECNHQFSKPFEQKMKKLFCHAKYHFLNRIAQVAACFLLIVSLGFSSILVFSVEARAAILNWVKETYNSFIIYFIEDESPNEPVKSHYVLGWIPEGYFFQEEYTDTVGTLALYSNQSSQRLSFSYLTESSDTVFLTDGVEYIQHHPVVNGITTDVYLAPDSNESNIIVWVDPNTNTLLYITGYVTEEELIQMAESVSAIEAES